MGTNSTKRRQEISFACSKSSTGKYKAQMNLPTKLSVSSPGWQLERRQQPRGDAAHCDTLLKVLLEHESIALFFRC